MGISCGKHYGEIELKEREERRNIISELEENEMRIVATGIKKGKGLRAAVSFVYFAFDPVEKQKTVLKKFANDDSKKLRLLCEHCALPR